MVVQIKSGKRENGTSFWDNLYRKRSTTTILLGREMRSALQHTKSSYLSGGTTILLGQEMRQVATLCVSALGYRGGLVCKAHGLLHHLRLKDL